MRVYGPKGKDHPTIGRTCPACGKPFAEGDYTTLITMLLRPRFMQHVVVLLNESPSD